jgi:peptidoglycan/LPS O-acetylase OafA/YrhL
LSKRHVPALDGIRGLAIVAVLMRHVAYVFMQHGSITRWFLPVFQFGMWGVDLFFVLSGFLITGILIDTRAATNRARSFYGRRILRIFPVYYLTIAVVFVGEHFSPWIKTAANLQNLPDHLSYLFYFQNFIPMWHHGLYPESIIGPFWSLAIEEQFYLIWPMVVWRLAPRSIVKVCAVALCSTLALRLILVPNFGDGIWLYALTPTRADGLFVGAALAAIYRIRGEFSKPLLQGLTSAGCVCLAAVAIFAPVNELWLTGQLMSVIGISGVALLCGALIVFCLRYNEGRLAKVFQLKWMRSLGKYSYGMYVFHLGIYYGVQYLLTNRFHVNYPLPTAYGLLYFAVLLGLTYGLAWLSFNYFESWFLGLKRFFEPVFPEEPKALSASEIESEQRGRELLRHQTV